MPYRKSLIQISFRLRQDTLRKLEHEAKRHDRSTTDEIMRRLEDSLTFDDWREKREQLLLEMRAKLARHLKEPWAHEAPPVEKAKAHRLAQARYRLRQDILNKIEHEAKRRNRSTHDEIGIRLDASFSRGDWWDQLMPLISALINDAKSHSNPAATIAAYKKMETEAERDIQDENMSENFPKDGP